MYLYVLGTRLYDPNNFRFVSPDRADVIFATPNGLTDKNLYVYCGNNSVNYKEKPISCGGTVIVSYMSNVLNVSSGGSVTSSSISVGGSSVSTGGSSGGGSLGGVENPTAPWWASTAVGAIPDFILGMRYLAAGVALPGIVVVGGVVILSIGFEHLIRAISDYWD